MRTIRALLAACAALTIAAPAHGQPTDTSARPNIVLILADDVAFSDFGAYGGEARTPAIDRLAAQGAQFSRYYTSPLCAPSRAMLLTGADNHRTGLATIPEVLPPEHVGRPGYTMRLEPGVVTVAERLRAGGYRTYMTGKWHLGHDAGDLPNEHGFTRSFALDASGADNWSQRPYMPYYNTAPWFEDGRPAQLPENFYSSEFMVDQMIRYLEADKTQTTPFFAYVAFQAVHIPVQAPAEFTRHYDNVYDAGWEVIRQQRAERTQALGLIPHDAPIAPMHPDMRAWNTLSSEEQAIYARSMQVHAGMLEAMDHHIGRLIAYLEQTGQAQNTIFIVTSDNGPEPSNPLAETGFTQWMQVQGYTRRLSDLGEQRSYVFIGPEWASATAAPGNLFKFYAAEGGLHVPFVVAGPGIGARRVNARAFVTDVTPTLLDYAGLPQQSTAGQTPISGRSMRAVLQGASPAIYGPDDAVGMEVSGNSALYRSDYKLVRNMPRWGDGQWRLYNLATDPNETQDLSASNAELFASMRAAYDAYASANGVLELPDGYDPQRQVARNSLLKQVGYYKWTLLLIGAALLALIGGGVWLVMRMLRKRRPA